MRLLRPRRRSAPGIPNWLDAPAYAPLLQVGRSGFAWEWLRRLPSYQDAALAALERGRMGGADHEERALAWHLHRFEDPHRGIPDARPLWSAARYRWVVDARADYDPSSGDCLNISNLSRFTHLVRSLSHERLLLSDGIHTIRLDVNGASLEAGPVHLKFEICGIRSLERPLLVLNRLRSLVLSGRFARSLYPRIDRASRLIMLLRTSDALDAGASQADIAQSLLRATLEPQGWRIHSPSLRSQAQRLVRSARRARSGEFWHLLS